MAIIIFGDSITNRAQDEEGGGWTSRLWKRAFDAHATSYGEGIVFADISLWSSVSGATQLLAFRAGLKVNSIRVST